MTELPIDSLHDPRVVLIDPNELSDDDLRRIIVQTFQVLAEREGRNLVDVMREALEEITEAREGGEE